jgi:hypothetical protein
MRNERKARFRSPGAPICEADPQGARGVSPPRPAKSASNHAPQGRHPGGPRGGQDTGVVLLYAPVDDEPALRKLAGLLGDLMSGRKPLQ